MTSFDRLGAAVAKDHPHETIKLNLARASQTARDAGGAATNPATVPSRCRSPRSIHLKQGFEGIQLNTTEMIHLATLAADLLANFRTVHLPSSEHREDHADWWARAKAKRAEHRAAYACRDRIRNELVDHGYRHFLHHMEPDPAGGWRLHFFIADDTALTVLDQLTEWECGPGDPVSFDPEGFVSARLPQVIPNDTDYW